MTYHIGSAALWTGFSVFIIAALSLDTFLLKNIKRAQDSIAAALIWSLVWISLALLFNFFLWLYLFYTTTPFIAHYKGLEFLTGYLIEKSLSVDNLFAFYMVFHHFQIPVRYQQRVFSIGIWSAVILRLLIILAGSWLIKEFHWMLYLMGLFLLLTGIRMFFVEEKEKDLSETTMLAITKRFIRVTPELQGDKFFIRKNHLLYGTPLILALVFIEFSDIVFAFDSIPAIFAITTDPFIIWSSNIFAILGLRALYFVLAGMVTRFYLLKYAIALILVFVGSKMLIEPWLPISVLMSLGVIISILGIFIGLSIWQMHKQTRN